MKKIIPILMISLLFSCQTEIDIDIPQYHDKLVVEGYIETGKAPVVMLSRSVPYFSTIDINTLMNNVLINNAVITVTSSDGISETLRLTISEEYPLLLAYTGTGRTLVGEPNKRYDLKIEWEDKTYTASTTIPESFQLDSLWLYPFGRTEDSISTVRILLSDDPSQTNYYQFLVKVHGKNLRDRLWVYTLPPVFDDATFNGLTFNYEILRSTPSTLFAAMLSDEEKREYYRIYYRPGDTIFVKSSLMDYNSYRFWSTAMSEISFGQNVFMSPPPIESNIRSNTGEKVLGSWCGYGSKIDTLIYSR